MLGEAEVPKTKFKMGGSGGGVNTKRKWKGTILALRRTVFKLTLGETEPKNEGKGLQ